MYTNPSRLNTLTRIVGWGLLLGSSFSGSLLGAAVDGYALDQNGKPLDKVFISYSTNADPAHPLGKYTDPNGHYFFLLTNGTYTVTATKDGYACTPSMRVYAPPYTDHTDTYTCRPSTIPTCTFQLPTGIGISYPAFSGTIPVQASRPTCQWSAGSGTPWITLSGTTTGAGTGTITFTAAANLDAQSRRGVIRIAGSVYTVQQEGLVSSFDNFKSLRFWRKAGQIKEGGADGCTTNPGSNGGTTLCSNWITQAIDGTVILSGQVVKGERFGSELSWKGDLYPLPVESTFAVSIRLHGTTSRNDSAASIKAFTPYAEIASGCFAHMEQDFEALTGRSALYSSWISRKWWPSDIAYNRRDQEGIIMTNVTHYCSRPADEPQQDIHQQGLSRLGDGFITLVVQIRCTANCSGAGLREYESDYSAVSDLATVALGATKTSHHASIVTLAPQLVLWWLQPPPSTPPITTDAQKIDVAWFLWYRGRLDATVAHHLGKKCDVTGAIGPNQCQ